MGLGGSFAEAFAKAQRGAGQALPRSGAAFISARDADKPEAVALAVAARARRARPGRDLGHGDGAARAAGLEVRDGAEDLAGLAERGGDDRGGAGSPSSSTRPGAGYGARTDGFEIRAAAVRAGIPCITTIEAGEAAAAAIASEGATPPRALQDLGGPARAGGAFRPSRSTL